MKFVVTGGRGFIGSHFVELLLKECDQCNIDVVDILDYCVSPKTADLLYDKSDNTTNTLEIFEEDINYFKFEKEYDYVVNFAAQSHVDRSIASGDEFLKSNIHGMYHLLNQVKEGTRFVQIGTDEVYGSLDSNAEQSKEEDNLEPSSVYSSTKASADLIALSHNKTHNTDVIVTRCCNNFGPRQYPEKLIPVAVNKLLKNEKIPVYGDGKNTRQWIYVKDHCQQVYDAMLYGTAGEIYNIAPSYIDADSGIGGSYISVNTALQTLRNEVSNIDLIHQIIGLVYNPKYGNGYHPDDYGDHIEYVTDRKGHDWRYSLNGSKLRSLIEQSRDIQQELPYLQKTFASDLEYTIMWYIKNQDWWENGY